MSWSLDARIPVVFASAAELRPDDAVLLLGAPVPSHGPACACCVPRGEAGEALGRLFLARARGDIAFFRRVVCTAQDAVSREAVLSALRDDPVASARFRRG